MHHHLSDAMDVIERPAPLDHDLPSHLAPSYEQMCTLQWAGEPNTTDRGSIGREMPSFFVLMWFDVVQM